jgi:hypothetical protein
MAQYMGCQPRQRKASIRKRVFCFGKQDLIDRMSIENRRNCQDVQGFLSAGENRSTMTAPAGWAKQSC